MEKDWKLEYLKVKRKQLLAVKKAQAKKLGLEFNLSEGDLVYPETCPVLGIPLEHGEGVLWDNSPTIDRIDPKQGYVKGNVQVISLLANRMKNSATPEQLLAFASWVNNTYGLVPKHN